jgi:pimeloyl-ACP methyl ester carboxylesterase
MWNYQMVAFADAGFRCLAFDRRGHGRSEVPPHGYDYDTFADDLDAVIESFELRDTILVSHSMAAGEIVRYLTRHSGRRISRIVMLAPTTPFLLKTEDNPHGIPAEAFEALRAGWKKDYPRWVAENTDPFFSPETSPAMKAWMASMITKIPLPVAIACNQAMATSDFRTEMKSINVPALIIHGDRDVSAPLALTGRPSAALIPGCRLKVYEGAPHGLMYTHSERLHEDILSFISDPLCSTQ